MGGEDWGERNEYVILLLSSSLAEKRKKAKRVRARKQYGINEIFISFWEINEDALKLRKKIVEPFSLHSSQFLINTITYPLHCPISSLDFSSEF